MPPSLRFTLDQHEVLQAIKRTGSFAGAAKELHRVPSAISYAVRTLEEALGLQLSIATVRILSDSGLAIREVRRGQSLEESFLERLGRDN